MPEAPEVDTDRLHEQIQEEVERDGGASLKAIALTTALFAALASVAALRAAGTVNEALALKAEVTRFQAEASDQWAAYQAKGIKSAIQAASKSAWIALGRNPPRSFGDEQQRYAREQTELSQVARQKERARHQTSADADHLMHQHPRFADNVALLQVAIALAAVSALTRVRLIWFGSIIIGLGGTSLLLLTALQRLSTF